MNHLQLTTLALATLTLTACKTVTYNAPAAQHHQSPHSSSNYTLGNEQSPINIPSDAPVHAANIHFNYNPMPLEILNSSHTIQVNSDNNSTITIEDTTYTLLQLHFHALSEHTFNNQPAPMEVHFVHQSDEGQYAVIGVFLNDSDSTTHQSTDNPNYAPIFNNFPTQESEPTTIAATTINPLDLLPSTKTYHRYNGSFTTPPYTQGVKWFMMSNPITLSPSQIAAFTTLYPDNYRPTQPLNNRIFIASTPSDD